MLALRTDIWAIGREHNSRQVKIAVEDYDELKTSMSQWVTEAKLSSTLHRNPPRPLGESAGDAKAGRDQGQGKLSGGPPPHRASHTTRVQHQSIRLNR